MLTFETEILEDRQAKLVVTVDPARLEKEMKQAARHIAKHVTIPGFRKGKAPYNIIKQYYGEEAIFEEALEPLGQEVYGEALKESGLDPYSAGVLTDYTQEPLVLTFTVPLMPEIAPGDYRALRLPYEENMVTEEDVQAQLEELRESQASLDPVERAVQMGDVAMLDIVGVFADEVPDEDDDGSWLDRKGVRVKIDEEATYPVPGFPAQVIGMSAGDDRAFDISFEADDESIAEELHGKTLHFEVHCAEVYVQNLPELNDDLAKDLGEFDSLDELKERIRGQLEENAQRTARSSYMTEIFTALLDGGAEVSYPPVMVEEQIDRMVDSFENDMRSQGLSLDDYQKIAKVTLEQIREDMREAAERRLKESLLLGEIVEEEELSVSEDEISDEIETAILPFGAQAAMARSLFASPEGRKSIANSILTDKGIDRLIAIARGEDPPKGNPPAPVAEEETEEAADAEAGTSDEETASTGNEPVTEMAQEPALAESDTTPIDDDPPAE